MSNRVLTRVEAFPPQANSFQQSVSMLVTFRRTITVTEEEFSVDLLLSAEPEVYKNWRS